MGGYNLAEDSIHEIEGQKKENKKIIKKENKKRDEKEGAR